MRIRTQRVRPRTLAGTLLALSIALGVAACSGGSDTRPPGVDTSGDEITESIDVGRFIQKIDAGNGWLVQLTADADPSTQASVEIRINSQDKDKITAEYRRGTLTLRAETGVELSAPPTAIVTVNKLTDATLSGGAKIDASGTFEGKDLEAQLTEGSNLTGDDANLQEVTLDAADQSKVSFASGSMNTLAINGTGNASFDLEPVASNSIVVTLSDTSSAKVGISNTLSVTASGSAELQYGGEPQIVAQSVTDSAKIESTENASGS